MNITSKPSAINTIVPKNTSPVATPPSQNPDLAQAAKDALSQAMDIAGKNLDTSLIRPKSLKEQAMTPLPETGRSFLGKSVEIGPSAITRNLVNRARQAGMNEYQLYELRATLTKTKNFNSDASLVNDLLSTQNPKAGIATFLSLDSHRAKSPDRITPDIMRALTMGVGQGLSANPPRDGVLNEQQANLAAETLRMLSPSNFNLVQAALSKAGQANPFGGPEGDAQTERALILKYTAGLKDDISMLGQLGQPFEPGKVQEILKFADEIRGMDHGQLIDTSDRLESMFKNG